MSLLLLILFWFTCISYTFQQQQQQQQQQQHIVLNIPIELHGKSGDTKFLDFNLYEGEDVHNTVSNFCFHNNIENRFCQVLMKSVLDKLDDSSEKLGYFIGQNKIERLKEAVFNEAALGKTGNVILDAIDINIPSDISRMAVIHSCTLEEQVNDILADTRVVLLIISIA